MENINKYVGIRHLFNGDSVDGSDCIGLCRLFYCDHGWKQNFTDGKPVTEDWEKKEPFRLIRYLEKNFKREKDINNLSFGDIVLVNFNGDYHTGIFLEYGKVLAMQIPCVKGESMSTIYSKPYWKPIFVQGYRRDNGKI